MFSFTRETKAVKTSPRDSKMTRTLKTKSWVSVCEHLQSQDRCWHPGRRQLECSAPWRAGARGEGRWTHSETRTLWHPLWALLWKRVGTSIKKWRSLLLRVENSNHGVLCGLVTPMLRFSFSSGPVMPGCHTWSQFFKSLLKSHPVSEAFPGHRIKSALTRAPFPRSPRCLPALRYARYSTAGLFARLHHQDWNSSEARGSVPAWRRRPWAVSVMTGTRT